MEIKRSGSQRPGFGALQTGSAERCAAPGTAMTHIAIQQALDGKMADWTEKVTDEQYQAAASKAK